MFCLLLSYLLLVSSSLGLGDYGHGGEGDPPLFLPVSQNSFPGDYSLVADPSSGAVESSLPAGNFSVQGQVESPDGDTPTLVLAPRRTYRKDPLNGFTRYTGGWNISSRHYWASVGYTAAPFFITAASWFIILGVCALLACVWCCCSSQSPMNGEDGNVPRDAYSPIVYAIALLLLVVFSIAAIVGCVVMYTGQGRFHSSTINTLDYVVRQADTTSDSLRNISEYLSAAKQVSVDQVSLPPEAQADIDQTQTKIDSSASILVDTTNRSSKDIKNLMNRVRLALIMLTALMLLLMFLGLVFSILGMQIPVYILVAAAWILVTGTLILCGVFLLLHNVTGDTCVAMKQWVEVMSPVPGAQQRTALDDVLGCVDNATVQEALSKTKQVTSQLVDVINTVITNVSNINFAPNFAPMYYNQSGPLLPTLCNPFRPDLTDRQCTDSGAVDLSNATQAWSGYVCQTVSPSNGISNSSNDVCITPGRLTPALYNQMAATVNVSYGLYQLGPVVAALEDCSFVRETFLDIDGLYCPALRKYSQRIYVGLAMVAAPVMLSMVFWVIYGRKRSHSYLPNQKNKKPKPREEEVGIAAPAEDGR